MADNIILPTSDAGGATVALDDIGGVKYPRSKIVIGADGTNDGDVSAANPLPVKGTGTAGTANAGVVTIQGIASMTAVAVSDNAGSLTVDAPVGTPVFVRLSDGSAAITTLPVSLASVPSHAVTNAGTFAVQATLADETTKVIGTVNVAAGQTLATVTTVSTVTNLSQLGGAAVPIGAGVEATALRVTLATDSTGVVSVDDNGGSITVDGTVAVSGTVTVGSHAVTNAGTFAVQVNGDALTRLTDIETNTDSLAVVGNGTAATAQRVTLANDSTGIVALTTSTASIGKLASNAGVTIGAVELAAAQTLATVTTVTTVTTCSTVTNLAQLGGAAIAMNTGTRSAGTQRVTIATDDIVPASQSGTWNIATVTTLTGITNALPAGTNAIGKLAANSGVDIGDVDVLSIAAGSNLIGDVSLQPRTTGGLTMSKTTSAASTNATSVKASAGQVYSVQCFNVNAAVRYLKLYDKASAPTVGTDTPVKTLAIPGDAAGAGFVISWPQGLAFATGIAFALTTEATDAGTTGVAANEITVNLDYK